jgi:hypothetical protein
MSLTYGEQIIMVREDPFYLEYVQNQTLELCLIAVKKNE